MGNTADINDADNNEDDEIAMENCTNVPTVNVDEINESVKEMKVRITSLAPSTPTEIHSKQEKRKLTRAKLNKPPHCKTCHHPIKGHSSHKSLILLDGYEVVRKDRSRIGGGVCIDLRSSINYKIRSDMIPQKLKAVSIEICKPLSKPFIVSTI